MLTDRVAHLVCYPEIGGRDRIITVRETEHPTAMSLLRLCRVCPSKRKADLQAVCQIARAELRRGAPEVDVIEAALKTYRPLVALGVALAAASGFRPLRHPPSRGALGLAWHGMGGH